MDDSVSMEIRDYLIAIIEEESYEENKLPSENVLAKKFETSRYKVRKVYEVLEEMGLAKSIQGVGRFKHTRFPSISLAMTGESFTSKMEKNKIPLLTKNIGLEKIDPTSEFAKNSSLQGNIYKISRLRIIYDIPAAIHSSYISDKDFPDILNEGNKIKSISSYYKEKGISDWEGRAPILKVKFPSSKIMEILDCHSLIPLLVLENELYKEDGSILEFTETIYRADLFTYEI